MKTYSVCYSRCVGAGRFVHEVHAEDFLKAVELIKDTSADSGPVIYFVIELPEEKKA